MGILVPFLILAHGSHFFNIKKNCCLTVIVFLVFVWKDAFMHMDL